MRLFLKIPARINILGNPSDANEGDFATISAAVNLYAYALIESAPHLEILYLDRKPGHPNGSPSSNPPQTIPHPVTGTPLCVTGHCHYRVNDIPLEYNGQLDLVKGAINRLYQYSRELRTKLNDHGVRIAVWSDVPRQSGLGGSSLFVLLTLVGLRSIYQLAPHTHNDYVMAELAQRVEGSELHIACGFADRYVPLFGGLAYLDYRGKLFHHDLHEEPLVTYERLDRWVTELPLLAVTTGIQHDSGDVHGKMRPRYLDEYSRWEQTGGADPPMVLYMKAAWETAWRGKIALLRGDWITFGRLMNENHQHVNDMMTYCGFQDGAGWANNLFIDSALKNGALGAKLTGAGAGGSVFALTQPGEEHVLKETWLKTAHDYQLNEAVIFQPRVSKQGVIVQEFD